LLEGMMIKYRLTASQRGRQLKGKSPMHLQTAKQEAIDVINHLPDTVNFDDILYRLFVVKKIHQGLEQAEQGQGISSEELLREMEQW
jgi:hypothetical protein